MGCVWHARARALKPLGGPIGRPRRASAGVVARRPRAAGRRASAPGWPVRAASGARGASARRRRASGARAASAARHGAASRPAGRLGGPWRRRRGPAGRRVTGRPGRRPRAPLAGNPAYRPGVAGRRRRARAPGRRRRARRPAARPGAGRRGTGFVGAPRAQRQRSPFAARTRFPGSSHICHSCHRPFAARIGVSRPESHEPHPSHSTISDQRRRSYARPDAP